MVSSRIILQTLLAVSAAIAAPTLYAEDGMYNARDLSSSNYPEERSFMPGHQVSTRGLSPLSIRVNTPSPPPHTATNAEKKKWHKDRIPGCKEAVRNAKAHCNAVKNDPNSTKKQKDSAKGKLHTAQESLEGHRESIEYYQGQINAGHARR
ncbi:hypothetical protein D9615_003241 [Tricholomella constricta]|uniref:Uncharacterized protein n=1 Tax=Tricholomella constricta TaxID=117010 RepID=A0A8H5HJ51_9AGAR|nr:hypothetical protein D9615_003241 [Tricholomella constricta]